MSMGSPGDSPLTDLLKWGQKSEFPEDISLMLLRLNNEFPEEILRLPNSMPWISSGDGQEEGRRYLIATLERRGLDTTYYRSLTMPKPKPERKWWQLWK
jgi:hypothetical protein